MADVQIEDGYTKIANELLEALSKTNLSNYEFRVFMAILRKTYGYQKKLDWLSLSQLSKLTGIQTPNICRTINKLITKNMLIKNGRITGIQKDYEKWNITQTGSTQTGNIIHTDSIHIDKTIVYTDNKKLSIQTDTKEIKETIQKKYIIEIFNYWNKKEIIIHKKLDQATESKINAKLKDYTLDEIKDTIHNYSVILKEDDYWWDYKWTLKDFLQRGFEKFKDSDVAQENYLRKDKK